MLGLAVSAAKGGAALLTYVKDNLKLYLDFKSNKSDTLKFPSEGSTSFDGSSDFIACGELDSNTFTNSYDGGLTMSAWFKTDVIEYAGIMELGLNSSSNFGTAHILVHGDNSQVGLRINNASTAVYSGNNTIVAGQWYHVTTVYNGATNKIKIYLDGEFKAEATASNALDFNSNGRKITLGAYKSSFKLDGQLANASIWSRALEPEEIQSIMNKSYSQLKGVEKTSLVSWWALDSASNGVVQPHDGETLGSNLVDANTSSGWFDNGDGSTITNITDGVSVADDSGFSDIGYFRDSSILSTDLTVGKLYKVQVDAYHNGVATIELRIRDGATNELINLTTNNTTYTRYIVAQDATGGSIRTNNHASGSIAYLTNLSVKEVTSNTGFVTGATTTTSVYGGNAPVLPRAVDVAKEGQADAIGNGSVSFDGGTDRIEISDFTHLNAVSKFTITAWMKRLESNDGVAIEKSADGANRLGINLYTDGKVYINVGNGGLAYGGTDLAGTDWNHVAVVFDGSLSGNANRAKIYINGISQTVTFSGTIPTETDSNTNILYFGLDPINNQYSTGNLSQVGFWLGALTQAQIQSVMESTSYSKIPSSVKSTLGSELVVDMDTWSMNAGTATLDTSTNSVTIKQEEGGSNISFTNYFNGAGLLNSNLANGFYKLSFNVSWDNLPTSRKIHIYEDGTNVVSTDMVLGENVRYFNITGSNVNHSLAIYSTSGNNTNGIVISNLSLKAVTNDIVAYYPLDAVQPSDFLYAKYVPEATAGVLGAELFTGWENEPVQSGTHYKGWSSFTTSGQTVTASQADEGAVYSKVFNTNAFSVVADTAYEINITIDSRTSTYIRGLTSSTNSEGTFVVYTSMWNDTTVGSAKYVLLANTTTSSARLHIRQQGGDGTASITISAISIKPLSGNYGRLL